MSDGSFVHPALALTERQPVIFPALSKRRFYMRMLISRFVLEQGGVPLNPFMVFDYFLADTVERDVVRRANNNMVALADELWVFGEISNGVLAEIIQAKQAGKPIKYFAIRDDRDFEELTAMSVELEDEVADRRSEL